MSKPKTAMTETNLWQRMSQYQPTNKLAKIILYWWLVVVVITSIKVTNGFGISAIASVLGYTEILLSVSLLFIITLCIFVVCDGLLLKGISQKNNFKVHRSFPKNIAIFHELSIDIFLHFLPDNLSGISGTLVSLTGIKQCRIEFDDDFPAQLALNQEHFSDKQSAQPTMPINVLLPIKTDHTTTHTKKISYSVLPIKRGTGFFGQAFLRVYSPMGLLRRRLSIIETTHKEEQASDTLITQSNNVSQEKYLRVLADFTGLLSNELSAIFERSYDAGIQTLRQQGQGSEFLKIREYAVGDSMRQIDWKASSRQKKLMSKSYEDENDQDIIFLLDCGEQMRHKESGSSLNNASIMATSQGGIDNQSQSHDLQLNYFDKVLNAILFLAYFANKQGDKIGLMTFGSAQDNERELFLPPSKGVSLMRKLLNATADLNPSMQTSDYYLATQSLKKSLKKRSLIIVITNTRQEASDELIQSVKQLSASHQVVFANLTEQSIQDNLNLDELPTNLDDALLYHSLKGYEQMREKLHRQLSEQTGSLCFSSTANKLPHTLTTAYMMVKRS